MFDAIVNALAQQFSLGDKARPFLQMLLARIDDPARGGLSGFMQRLRTGGMGDEINDWAVSRGTVTAAEPQVLEAAMGDDTLVPDMAARFGLDHRTALAAIAYAVPALIGQFASGGVAAASLPPGADAFIGNRADWTAHRAAATAAHVAPATPRAAAAMAPKRNWLPLIIAAVVALLLLGYCTTRDRPDRDAAPAPQAAAPVATAPAEPVSQVVTEPEGAGVLATPPGVVPALKVYFDTGKADVASDFAAKAGPVVEYMKANTITTAVISGFNDPTGDAAANARLAKQRAEAVQQALVAAGAPLERTVLEKPAETTGTGASNAASRRVDVVLRE